METQQIAILGKDGHRQMMKIRLTNLHDLGYEINIYQKYEMGFW